VLLIIYGEFVKAMKCGVRKLVKKNWYI